MSFDGSHAFKVSSTPSNRIDTYSSILFCEKMYPALNVVHIGKCGGSTVRLAIAQSELLAKKFGKVKFTHISQVKYSQHEKYLIVIRNPIARAISAFNWRYHLVVETEQQRERFKGEWHILKKYLTLNSISERLYSLDSESLNQDVSREFKVIHHLREDISFYLSEMLEQLRPGQVYGIIKQHSLAADCSLLLGPNVNIQHEKRHGDTILPSKKELSGLARRNLRRYLYKDFSCILKLYNLGLMAWDDYELLTR